MQLLWTAWASNLAQKIYTAALVGCGRIGYSLGLDTKREQPASHTMALNANSRIKLIAGCDTDLEALDVWHKANARTSVYQTSRELYKWQKPDIITIAVNEDSHKSEAIAAICAHPKLVILEKPVALNSDEAGEIKSASAKNKVPVLINHERRFAEDYKLAKKYISEIGQIQSVYGLLSSSMCVYNPEEESTGAYSLIHDGTHLVDAVLYLLDESDKFDFGKPVLTGVFRDEKNCVRQLSAHFSTKSCPEITFSISGRSRYFGFEIQINGTEGRICIGNNYFKMYRRETSPLYSGFYSLLSDGNVKPPAKTLYFANMVQNAVDFLDGKTCLKSDINTGLQALKVLESIKESLQK